MFSDAEPYTENSLSEPSVTPPAGNSSAAASAVPAREESTTPGPEPVAACNGPAAMNLQPNEGQNSETGAADTSGSANGSAPSETSPAETSSVEAEATAGESGSPSADELSELMDQYATPHQAPTEGEIVEGRVIAVSALGVVVDFGRKSEGLVPAEEFIEAEQVIQFGPGQTIEVQITGEHKDGYALLSHQRARRRRVWANLEKAYHDKTNIKVKVVDRVKGGLVVDAGVRAFLPASQADLRPVHDIEEWKDREVEVRVLKLNRKRGNVVVSRRAILEDEQKGQRQKLIDSLAEGQVLHGSVKSITSYGVFVDLGGLDGLLHVSDLSWGRVTNPADVVQPGDELDVQVLKFDREKLRISLGRKQLLPDPWPSVPERFPAGTQGAGPRGGHRGLRRVCGAGAGSRGLGARFGDELEQAQAASLQAGGRRAIRSRPWCWRSSRSSGESPWASSRRRPIRGPSWRRSIRWGRRSPARCAALPTTARLWRSNRALTG